MTTINDIFKENKGFLHSVALKRNGRLYHKLKEMIDAGVVEKIRPGLYIHKEMVSGDEFLEVSKMYPNAVLCLFSAWSYYNLTTHVPWEYHLAIPHKKKLKAYNYPPVKFYYWTTHDYEIEEKNGIRIYSIERTVVDVIRFENMVGTGTTAEVVKNYLKREDRNLSKLFEVAKKLKAEKRVRTIIELLI